MEGGKQSCKTRICFGKRRFKASNMTVSDKMCTTAKHQSVYQLFSEYDERITKFLYNLFEMKNTTKKKQINANMIRHKL